MIELFQENMNLRDIIIIGCDKMDFDLKIKNKNLTIYCSRGLENFSNEFINYYYKNIDRIKEELSIIQEIEIIVVFTDDKEKAGFVYGESSFSGFFNNYWIRN